MPSVCLAILLLLSGVAAAGPSVNDEGPAGPEDASRGSPSPMFDVNQRLDEAQKRIDAQAADLQRLRAEFTQERYAQKLAHQAELESMRRTVAEATAALDHLTQTSLFGRRKSGFELALTGYLQVDGVLYNETSQDEINFSTGQPINMTRFLIRRARLRADITYGLLYGFLEFDGNTTSGATARILGGEVAFRWPGPQRIAVPYVMGAMGLFKIPFGFEVGESDRDRLFLERANVLRALFPGEFDLGVRVQGGWHALRYVIAAMNGSPAGAKQFAAVDPLKSKDFLARIGIDTQAFASLHISGGVSAVYGNGFSTGVGPTKDALQVSDKNKNGIIDDTTELVLVPGKPAVPSQTFSRYAVGGDLQMSFAMPKLGLFSLRSEFIWATNMDRGMVVADPVALGRPLHEIGYYVGFTQELTRHAAIGVRYDWYNPDMDATSQQGGMMVPTDVSVSTLALTAAALYGFSASTAGRLILEYDRNGNNSGRDAQGLPTRMPADVLTIRGEFAF